MKTPWRHLAWLGSVLFLAVSVFAQSGPSLNGSYAFLANVKEYDSFGDTGGAVVGILNFDGAGNVSGTAALKARTGEPLESNTASSPVRGTYTMNPDGTANANLDFTDFGFSAKLAVVITDGGKGIQFVDGPGSTGPLAFPLALNPILQGAPEAVRGVLPADFFLQRFRPGAQAAGTIPLLLNRTYNDGVAIYSLAAPATGSGTATCPNGTAGNWSATIPTTTVVMRNTSGDFMMPVLISGCGGQSSRNYAGLANLNITPNGTSLVLHLTGSYSSGTGRTTTGAPPQGVYGVQLLGEPFPNATMQTMNFDGSGGITSSGIGPAGTIALTGTYTANADGTGTISFVQNANPTAVQTFAYVAADDASTIYLVRTSGVFAGADIISGVGHLQ